MQSLKTIRLVYVIYSIYTFFVLAVSDYNLWIAILGLLAIWMVYFAYALGYESISHKREMCLYDETSREEQFFFSKIASWKNWQYFLTAVVSWVCSVLSAQFYTGRGFLAVLLGVFRGEKAYSIYQHYVVDEKIGAFSLAKIPFILMLTYTTVTLFWSMLGLICSNMKLRKGQIIYLLAIIASYLYFGLARGTNFEMYIIFVLLFYCLLNKKGEKKSEVRNRRKMIIILSVLAVGVVLVFRAVVAARGNKFDNQICTEIHYDDSRLFSQMFPTITNMGLSVFRYFGFGIFTIGMAMDNIVLESAYGICSFLIPRGYDLFFNSSLVSMTRETVDVGVGWVPDYISFINSFGIIVMLFLFYLLGRINASLYYSDRDELLKNLVGAVVFLEMLSIPVGNFIATSTPNELTIILIIFWYAKGKYHFSFGGKGKR